MKKLIKLLFGLFRRKPAPEEAFDVDPSGDWRKVFWSLGAKCSRPG